MCLGTSSSALLFDRDNGGTSIRGRSPYLVKTTEFRLPPLDISDSNHQGKWTSQQKEDLHLKQIIKVLIKYHYISKLNLQPKEKTLCVQSLNCSWNFELLKVMISLFYKAM